MATHSKYSHMGIVYHGAEGWYVWEAIGPVKATPLAQWVRRGNHAEYAVKRLRNRELSSEEVENLKKVGAAFCAKQYDPYFGWSNERIYCSELVWKIYKSALGIELGRPRALGTFDLSSREVQSKLRQRYGARIPLHELAISPSDIFDSPLLETAK